MKGSSYSLRVMKSARNKGTHHLPQDQHQLGAASITTKTLQTKPSCGPTPAQTPDEVSSYPTFCLKYWMNIQFVRKRNTLSMFHKSFITLLNYFIVIVFCRWKCIVNRCAMSCMMMNVLLLSVHQIYFKYVSHQFLWMETFVTRKYHECSRAAIRILYRIENKC